MYLKLKKYLICCDPNYFWRLLWETFFEEEEKLVCLQNLAAKN